MLSLTIVTLKASSALNKEHHLNKAIVTPQFVSTCNKRITSDTASLSGNSVHSPITVASAWTGSDHQQCYSNWSRKLKGLDHTEADERQY